MNTLQGGSQKKLGRLIDSAMKTQGIAAYELARALHRQPSYVSRLVNGLTANTPDPHVLAELSQHLGVSQRSMLRALGYLTDEDEGRLYEVDGDDLGVELHSLIDQIDWDKTITEYEFARDFLRTTRKHYPKRQVREDGQ